MINIPKDKLYHLAVGTLSSFILSLVNPFFANLTLAIAYGKEYYDKQHPDKHTYDGWDAFVTSIGIPIGQILAALLVYYKFWSFLL